MASTPSWRVLLLVGCSLAAASLGLREGRVGSLPWPELQPLRAGSAGLLAEVDGIAWMERDRPGAGRERAAKLVRRLLEERAGNDPEFTVSEGPFVPWEDETVLELGSGSGHYGFGISLVRLRPRDGGAEALCVEAVRGACLGDVPQVGARRYEVDLARYRALLRGVEALASLRTAWRAPSAWSGVTMATWTSTTARSPRGVLFQEEYHASSAGTGDEWQSVRSTIANRLVRLVLHPSPPIPYPLGKQDREWLRSIFGRGKGAQGGFGECWEAVFLVAGDAEFRRKAESRSKW